MLAGSFCFRHEAEKIRKRLYRSLHLLARYRIRTKNYEGAAINANIIFDLTAGTGCLTELVLRADAVKGSNSNIAQVILIDKKPWTRVRIELSERLRQMPTIGRRLRVRFEAPKGDPLLEEIAETLNELIKVQSRSIFGRLTIKGNMPKFDVVLLRRYKEIGKAIIEIRPYEEAIRDRIKSNAKRLRKGKILFIFDPPRSGIKHNYYNIRKIDYFNFLKELEKHEGIVLYVDYNENIKKFLETSNFKVFSRYRLYNTGSGHGRRFASMVLLVPEGTPLKQGLEFEADKIKRKIKDYTRNELKNPLRYFGRKYERIKNTKFPEYDFFNNIIKESSEGKLFF